MCVKLETGIFGVGLYGCGSMHDAWHMQYLCHTMEWITVHFGWN